MIWDRDTHSEVADAGAASVSAAAAAVQDGEDGSVLLLRSSGSLMERRSSLARRVAVQGLMRTIRNFPLRKREWAFACSCSNPRTGEFALADARGQVYVLSPQGNVYRSVRLASTPVSSLGFVAARLNELIIAYENGSVLVVDTVSKDIIGNLQHSGNAAIRMIRAHPSKPVAMLVSDAKVVSTWSLAKMRCVRSFDIDEPVVDIRFEANGAITAVVLQESGVYLYRSGDFHLLQHCPLPLSERRACWLAYASHSLTVQRERPPDAAPEKAQKNEFQQAEFHLRCVLASESGMLYVWNAVITHASLQKPTPQADDDNDEEEEEEQGVGAFKRAELVGVVELPVTMRMAVAITSLAPVRFSNRQARLLVLACDGSACLVEVEDASSSSLGAWTVTLDLPASALGLGTTQLPPFSVGRAAASREEKQAECAVLDGRLSGQGDLFVVVAQDKSVRLFDADSALGLGSLAGTQLRSRLPYQQPARRPECWSQIDDLKQSADKGKARANAMAARAAALSVGPEGLGESFPWSQASRASEAARASHSSLGAAGRGDRASRALKTSFRDADARGSSALESEADGDDAPPPPYASQSVQSLGGWGAGGLSASATSLLPSAPIDGGDSPAGTQSRQQRLQQQQADKAARSQAREERQRQREEEHRQRDALEQGNYEDERAHRESLRLHAQAVAEAKVKRQREREARARERAEDAATRRAAREARIAQREAEGISARAMELFELAALTPAERDNNLRKLRGFLEVHGEFPPKYRCLIWRFCLQLPENAEAFAALRALGMHPACEGLREEYPLADASLLERLQQLCSQLCHWSPVFAEAKFLPQLAFPFVVQFSSDDLSAFEAVASVMMWWGHTWMSLFPGNPSHIVDTIDALVNAHDPKLRYFFTRLGASAGQLGWAMMQTLFSEVLCRADWLRLTDFLVANFRHAGLFLLAPVALLRAMRVALLTTEKKEVLLQFCRRVQGVDVAEVIRDIKAMHAATPQTQLAVLVPRRLTAEGEEVEYARQSEREGPADDADDYSVDEEAPPVAEANPLATAACFPLPRGREYPRYDNYPAHLLDWQMKERIQGKALVKELHHKEMTLRALVRRNVEMQAEHDQWMARHANASGSEMQRRLATMEAERGHMKELLRMEEAISQQRVEALAALERVAEAELRVMDAAAGEGQALLEATGQHLDDKMALALAMARHRELAETAEVSTEGRLRELQLRRAREERLKALSGALQIKEQELDARDALLAEAWKKEDEAAGRKRAERLARAKGLVEDEVLGRLGEEMNSRMQRLVMEREAKVVELERARAVRQAREQTDEAIEAAERSALLLQKHELAASTERAAQLAAQGHSFTNALLHKTADRIRDESQRLVEAERVYALKHQRARQEANAAVLEKEWAERQSMLVRGAVGSEQELQEQALRLSRARAQTEAEEHALMEHQAALRDLEPSAALEQLGERVAAHQRSRFEDMRQALSAADAPRMAAQALAVRIDSHDARTKVAGASVEAVLQDKSARHERERRTEELLRRASAPAAPAAGAGEAIDADPALWSFRP